MNHICPECGRGFKSRLGLSIHFTKIHREKKLPPVSLDPEEYPFLCPICNERRFKSQRGLSSHISKTHGAKFQLSKEERTQRQTEIMRRHIIRKRKAQPQIYKHKCPMCEFRAISKIGLSSHMTRMHSEYVYFDHPVHVGFRPETSQKKYSTLYDDETLQWLERTSDKNLLAIHLTSGRADRGFLPSLKRNKIINRSGGYHLTAYGEELLLELQTEGKVKGLRKWVG